MQATTIQGTLAHVDRFSLHCTPSGELITRMGNTRIFVTPEEARELLEEMLARATRFTPQAEKQSSNGYATTH